MYIPKIKVNTNNPKYVIYYIIFSKKSSLFKVGKIIFLTNYPFKLLKEVLKTNPMTFFSNSVSNCYY